MVSITDFSIECSASACIGILAGLHFTVEKIIDDFVRSGKADPSYKPNDPNYPLKRAMNVFFRLKNSERMILPKFEYDYLMSYRELLYFEKPHVKNRKDLEFLGFLTKYTEVLNLARDKVSFEEI